VKILLDQDVPEPIVDPLRHLVVVGGHRLEHVQQTNWSGKKDTHLLIDAGNRGYQVFITNDLNQLDDPAETDAIKKSKLHHVTYTQTQLGLTGLGLAMAAILASVPTILEHLASVKSQRLVRIAAIPPSNRFTTVDPRKDPPRYWR
jgi:hypothetical protein